MKSLPLTPLLVLAFLLVACQSPAPPRAPQHEIWTAPTFADAELVDVAVPAPKLPEASKPVHAEGLREAARTHLIRVKGYASPDASYVDEKAGERSGLAAARAVNSDAVLVIELTKVDDSEFLGRGRLWVSGRLSLVGPDGELWRATFTDHLQIAATDPNTIAADQAIADTLGALVRQKMVSLPPKSTVRR